MNRIKSLNHRHRTAVRSWRNGIAVRIPDRLSDAVMTFPALLELKKIIPEHCGLFVIAHAYMTQLFEALPIVDKTVSIISRQGKLWTKNERREIRQLRAGAIVLFNDSNMDIISARLARIPQLFGFAGSTLDALLSARVERPKHPDNPDNHSPKAMQYLALVDIVGSDRWNGSLPRISSRIATNETDPLIRDICRHPQLLIIAPGAAGARCIPASTYHIAAKYWIRHGGIVAVVGAANERSNASAILSSLPKNKYFNLCGKTDFCALLHLFRHAAYTVAGDTGLMRLGISLDIHGLVTVGPADFMATDPVTAKWPILMTKASCGGRRKQCNTETECKFRPTAKQLLKAISKAQKELNFPFRKAAKKA